MKVYHVVVWLSKKGLFLEEHRCPQPALPQCKLRKKSTSQGWSCSCQRKTLSHFEMSTTAITLTVKHLSVDASVGQVYRTPN